jgi:epoxyqueuosine reductase
MKQEVLTRLEEEGYKGRVVGVEHLRDLEVELEARRRQGLIHEDLYHDYLAGFGFDLPEDLPLGESLILVAMPQPQIQVVFTLEGQTLSLIVPPTYLHARESDKRVEDLLMEILAPAGCRVAGAALPKKALAVHSGLGSYGKNNICYVPGMGSFHRLVAFYSDLPGEEDDWRELNALEACEKCSACLRICPTGAITDERFLIRAERCLTFLNEKPGDVPFPRWLEPSWHNCLVGCMHCQRVCPENRDSKDWVEEGEQFTEDETALLLEGLAADQMSATTREKLHRADLIDLLDVLPRNLRALFSQKSEE